MGKFEKYLTIWVLACIVAGIILGNIAGDSINVISEWEIATINIPVAILVWLMIYPMMVQIDFSSLRNVANNWRGLGLTVVMNWLVKPFTMAFFAWVFFSKIFAAYLEPEMAEQYIAGAILLGAAPCTAMVFVWSYLTKGDANYTLVQVSVNDLILLVAFIPIVRFLLGVTNIDIPYNVLFTSVIIFVAIPLAGGYLSHKWLMRTKGKEWFTQSFLPTLKPVSIIALLTTLVLLFSFQGHRIIEKPFDILLIAVPLTIQTYFIFFVTWYLGKYMKLAHNICAPAAMIGASNFFELAVAVAISLFGLNSGASLATVVGVLIEVPVMLSLVALANKWFYTIPNKMKNRKKVLVLCTGNSCRSQIAHGYLNHFGKDNIEVYSAGVETHGVNPKAIATMKEDGIDISHHTSNNMDEYVSLDFDYVITVCDNAKERCPYFPTKAQKFHHNFPDPAGAKGTEEEVMAQFREVREMIKDYSDKFVRDHIL